MGVREWGYGATGGGSHFALTLFSAWLQDKLDSAQAQKDEAERRSREQAELTGLRCSALEQENAGREGGGGAGKATHRNLFLQTSPSDKPL